jgi:phosphate transport system permease protein
MASIASPMTAARGSATRAPTDWASQAMTRRIRGRYAAEKRFRALGFVAVAASVLFLAFLLVNMAVHGIPGFFRTEIRLAIPVRRVATG